ncbi:hypothetical protein ACFQU8_03685 [Lentibacillus kimchii]|uniref:Sigma-54 factor interaction domain-containing protein n=1 Tax=Lentibacillus kimchii TaxID=1542911 RepID=A0ABW2URA3_9BACI
MLRFISANLFGIYPVSLFVPLLRERKEDIDLLTQKFIDKYNASFEMDIKGISSRVRQILQEHD